MSERLERLQNVFKDVFDDEALEITADTVINEIENWDSLLHISLMAAVQDEFGVSYDIDQITDMKTVKDIMDTLDGE